MNQVCGMGVDTDYFYSVFTAWSIPKNSADRVINGKAKINTEIQRCYAWSRYHYASIKK